MQCPVCNAQTFWAQDPEDEYERYRITLRGEQFVPEAEALPPFEMSPEIKAFCDRCAWHGRLGELKG